ncbi:hypothetical protein HBB16_08035 [Pseudonocardia sp. MCCB 268]|nr:hypothetical protein [Pseudonocardia cytotoxica]
MDHAAPEVREGDLGASASPTTSGRASCCPSPLHRGTPSSLRKRQPLDDVLHVDGW